MWSVSNNEAEQLKLLKKIINLYLQKSVARATEGRNPLTYQELMAFVKEVAADEGKSDFLLKQGCLWTGKKPPQLVAQVSQETHHGGGNNSSNSGNNTSGGGRKRRNRKTGQEKSSNPAAGVY